MDEGSGREGMTRWDGDAVVADSARINGRVGVCAAEADFLSVS